MTGHDFLSLAQSLATGTTEAEWRSAVSRAYYAAFHVARDAFHSLGFVVPRADSAHKYLAFRLQNCGHAQLARAGRDLDALRSARNEADYDLLPAMTQTRAKNQVGLGPKIIQAFAVTTVEPTRTQIRDAIIAYERTAYGQITWSPPP
jgi:uncharacterized protein (UPF0332 family)